MESKWSIYNLMPAAYYPTTLFFEAGSNPHSVIEHLRQNDLKYPLVGKPDIGMKGLAVKKLDNEPDLIEYILNAPFNFLVQEFVPYEKEAGIFYYRLPGKNRGRISGIVSKEFLSVEGDGISTVKQLLRTDKRHILQLNVLEKTYGSRLDKILEKHERLVLVPYGNHVRGAKFIDVSHMIDEKLEQVIDSVCQQVNGFYYGRMDIRYSSWEDLINGNNFAIIELNGAGSEPTHMYDPNHSIFFAWKEIIRHWTILWEISRRNHDAKHRPYMSIRSGLTMLKENNKYLKLIAGNVR